LDGFPGYATNAARLLPLREKAPKTTIEIREDRRVSRCGPQAGFILKGSTCRLPMRYQNGLLLLKFDKWSGE
jgi:ribosomal protein S14